MNRQECEQFVHNYLSWLRQGFSVEALGNNTCELTTPFLDRHNDHLQVYVVRRADRVVLSDDGYILSDLRTSGLELNTPKRKATLETVLKGFGVQLDGNALVVEVSERNFGQRLHSFVQAMLAVNDMFVMAQARVASFFWEDVRAFLDEHDVRYSPRVKIAGRSGFDHAVDFLVPKSRRQPERVVQAINVPNKGTITNCLFTVGDIREARTEPFAAYAFLNDRARTVGGDIAEALEAYGVTPALWTRRERYAVALSE
jgi:hypothetical protein